jgi:hypothetical protein
MAGESGIRVRDDKFIQGFGGQTEDVSHKINFGSHVGRFGPVFNETPLT